MAKYNGSTITIGLPKGSLNNPAREGYTSQILAGAGFVVSGYDSGNEANAITFENFERMKGARVTSQEGPRCLSDGELDFLIAGNDWIDEWTLRGGKYGRIMDLSYGRVRVVAAQKKDMVTTDNREQFFEEVFKRAKDKNEPVRCYTEMPMTAMHDAMTSGPYKSMFGGLDPLVVGPTGNKTGDQNSMLHIYHVLGDTESWLDRGATYIVDCVQGGSSLERAGGKIVHTIKRSQAGLYTRPESLEVPKLRHMSEYLKWMLKSGARTQSRPDPTSRQLVKANVRRDALKDVSKFLTEYGFCDVSPTVHGMLGNKGMVSLEVDIPLSSWPEMTYGIFGITEETPGSVRDILRIPVVQSLD